MRRAKGPPQNNDPVNQGIIAMLGTIIDTLIICTITALVILTSGVMTANCLASPAILEMLQSGSTPAGCEIGVPLTAAYGERCAAFIFKEKSIPVFRVFWVIAVFASTYALSFETGEGNMVVATFWLIADSLTGLMAAPNLIALILLSPVIFKLAKEYFDKDKIASDGLIDQDDIPPGKIDG